MNLPQINSTYIPYFAGWKEINVANQSVISENKAHYEKWNHSLIYSSNIQPEIPSKLVQVILIVLSIIGATANLLVCMAVLSVSRLRQKIVNCFVVSLCCTQILVDDIVMPMFCFAVDHFIYNYVVALAVISYITSLLSLTFDRYLAVCYSLRYRGLMWYSRAVRVIILCWILSFITQILPAFWNERHFPILHKTYLSFIALVFLFIPLCLVIFAYAAILKDIIRLARKDKDRLNKPIRKNHDKRVSQISETLTEITEMYELQPLNKAVVVNDNTYIKRKNRSISLRGISYSCTRKAAMPISSYRKETKTTLLLLLVGSLYGATWIPVLFMTILQIFDREDLIPEQMSVVSILIMAINSIIDPILYGFCMKDIRKQIKKIYVVSWFFRDMGLRKKQ